MSDEHPSKKAKTTTTTTTTTQMQQQHQQQVFNDDMWFIILQFVNLPEHIHLAYVNKQMFHLYAKQMIADGRWRLNAHERLPIYCITHVHPETMQFSSVTFSQACTLASGQAASGLFVNGTQAQMVETVKHHQHTVQTLVMYQAPEEEMLSPDVVVQKCQQLKRLNMEQVGILRFTGVLPTVKSVTIVHHTMEGFSKPIYDVFPNLAHFCMPERNVAVHDVNSFAQKCPNLETFACRLLSFSYANSMFMENAVLYSQINFDYTKVKKWEAFLYYLVVQGLKPTITMEGYPQELRDYMDNLCIAKKEMFKDDFPDVTPEQIKAMYFAHMVQHFVKTNSMDEARNELLLSFLNKVPYDMRTLLRYVFSEDE